VTAGLLLFKLTVRPLLPAGEVNATVHTSLAAPVIELLPQERLRICAVETNGNKDTSTNKFFIYVFFLSGHNFNTSRDVHGSVVA
jgi:hypothetical protein